MKKLLVILLAFVLIVMAGCAKEETAPTETVPATTVPETTEATIPVPETVEGIVPVDGVPSVLTTLSRGDTINVVDSFDEKHCVIKTESGYGLVEKNLVRMMHEPVYESWTGYAANNTAVYGNYRLSGEAVTTLKRNARVDVLEDLGNCYLICYEEETGYVSADKIGKNRQSSGGGGSGGGSSGGGSGVDGGDISLFANLHLELLAVITPQEGETTGQAIVLADGAEVILGYFDRNDTVPVVTEDGFAESREGYYTIYMNGLYAYVSKTLVQMEGEETYTAWDGFSKSKAKVYDNFWLQGTPVDKLNVNTKVHVLYELENCCFVEVEGQTGYMKKSDVGEKRFSTGGGGSGSGGGGGAEWSPAVL